MLGYWVSGIEHECFAGWHRPWALCFAVPAAVVLCLGVPLGLFWFLWHNRAEMADADFREHYGFLYRNYVEDKPWWESVWAVQTVLLTAVSVFHFTIQAFYALLVMEMIMLISAAVQVYARPYRHDLLHWLHLASTCCLFVIVWLSLAMFSASVEADNDALHYAHIVFGIIIIWIGSGFVLGCLVHIVRVASTDTKVRRYATCVVGWLWKQPSSRVPSRARH